MTTEPTVPNQPSDSAGGSAISREEFVERLNGDLGTEYQSIVQYNLHISGSSD
jgi:hypothetical protein